jgi:prolyl-tRNA synthetase
MTHSDDKGLVLPSKIAPHKVVVMTVFADKNPEVLVAAEKIDKTLCSAFDAKLDSSDKGIGYKSQE